MSSRLFFRGAALTAFLTAASLAPAQAQRWVEPEERGWIGISFQVDRDAWGRTSSVVITDVLRDSPAYAAGVRPGDRLLAINDLSSPSELERLGEQLWLAVGDRVVMEVERAGERRRLRLRAAERPRDVELGARVEVALSGSEQVESLVESMESMRIEIVEEGGGRYRWRTSVRSDGDETSGSGSLTVLSGAGASGVRAPFEFFVFRGEEHDSLKREMVELNREIETLSQRMESREREVRRRTRSTNPLHLAEDEEHRELSARIDEMTRRSAQLRAAMAEAARETAGFQYVAPAAPRAVQAFGAVETPRTPEAPTAASAERAFRPLTPYLLGRNRVAGAEVVDLKPELARYFDVDGGVLVVDVAEGTPAGLAGIVPGDVIVRVDRLAVRSVDDLRFGIEMAGDTLPVVLVRRGETARILLRRR